MCFARKKVNIDLFFANEYSQSSLEVSCGKCGDCRWRVYNDYLVRCWFEYKKVDAKRSEGAFAVFETLTYAEDNLPMFEGIPCFSSEHINGFIKRLKEFWRNKLGHVLDFSYIIVSEHGGKRGRPHYHPIFFVKENIDFKDFVQSVYDCWSYGKTDYVDTLGRHYLKRAYDHVLVSCAAIRYILKYLFKYSDFDKCFDGVLKKLSDRYDVDAAAANRAFFMHKCRPFIRTSVGFGFVPESELTADGRVLIPCGSGYQDLPAARYIIRKLCAQKVALLDDFGCPVIRPDGHPEWLKTDNGSYAYMKTPFGVQYSLRRLPDFLSRTAVSYKQILDTMPDYIKRPIYSFLHGRSLRQLAIYNIVYAGVCTDKWFMVSHADPFSVVTFTEFYKNRLSRNPQTQSDKYSDFSQFSFIDDKFCPEFADFDLILRYLLGQSNLVTELNTDKPGLIESYTRLHNALGQP